MRLLGRFLIYLQIALVLLKLLEVIDLAWWRVASPLLVPLALLVIATSTGWCLRLVVWLLRTPEERKLASLARALEGYARALDRERTR